MNSRLKTLKGVLDQCYITLSSGERIRYYKQKVSNRDIHYGSVYALFRVIGPNHILLYSIPVPKITLELNPYISKPLRGIWDKYRKGN